MRNLNAFLLVIIAFTAALNAIETEAKIDMHTMMERRRKPSLARAKIILSFAKKFSAY